MQVGCFKGVTGLSGLGKSSPVSYAPVELVATELCSRTTEQDDALPDVAELSARRRRYGAGRFPFNLPKGRYETCDGEGFVSVELLFMPGAYSRCKLCHGARYNPADALDRRPAARRDGAQRFHFVSRGVTMAP